MASLPVCNFSYGAVVFSISRRCLIKMSNRYLSKKTKTKKGISPVIATVILVAVAVVIAAALAGFSSSLFGSYSQSAQIAVRSINLNAATEDGSMDIVNRGGSAEMITKVSVTNFGVADDPTAGTGDIQNGLGAPVIDANSDATIDFTGIDEGPNTLTAGQTVTVTVSTESGQTYTLSTVVQS